MTKTLSDSDLNVATILDEFSEYCFKDSLNIHPLGCYSWEQQLNSQKIDFLLVESAWFGNRGKWIGQMTLYSWFNNPQLRKLITYCQKHDIPTVFWNKDDPPDFNKFIASAKKFDYIFTTDSQCVDKYKQLTSAKYIDVLPFAAQPKIHNPIGKIAVPVNDLVFPGTWFKYKYKERAHNLAILLNAARNVKLDIYDRKNTLKSILHHNLYYRFPKEYRQYIKPKLPYKKMLDVYRQYKIVLNVNSVTDSPTMFSRRIFEALACAIPVVSTKSLGVSQFFGDLVPICSDQKICEQEHASFRYPKGGEWVHRHQGTASRKT